MYAHRLKLDERACESRVTGRVFFLINQLWLGRTWEIAAVPHRGVAVVGNFDPAELFGRLQMTHQTDSSHPAYAHTVVSHGIIDLHERPLPMGEVPLEFQGTWT